jgi:intracellular multiplication protein IcmE
MALDKGFSRMGVLAGGGVLAAVLVVGAVLYGVSAKKAESGASNVAIGGAAQVSQAEPSPKYNQILNQHNSEQADKAVKTGESYVPVFTAPSAPQPAPGAAPVQVPPQYTQAGNVGPLSPALQQQVDALRRAWEAPGNAVIVGVAPQQEPGGKGLPAATAASAAAAKAPPAAKRSLLGKTPMVAAVLNTAIKTDEPSLVMATVTAGPMAGGVLHGEAKRAGEVVNVKFTTLFLNGHHITVNAVAIDEDSMRSALIGDVDHKYMARIGIPVLLGIMGGYAAAKAVAPTASVFSPLGSVTQATGNLSDSQITAAGISAGVQAATKVAQQSVDQSKDISVTIPQGQPIGVWFLADVVEP